MKRYLIILLILGAVLLAALDVDVIDRNADNANNGLEKDSQKYEDVIPSLNLRGTLLQDHFGVNPTLTDNTGFDEGQTVFSFTWSSLAPTKNTETVSWIESDFYGKDDESATHHGTFPSGGERYDVEALYMDNDNDNIYLAVITSVPHYRDYGNGNAGVGIYDSRYSGVWVRPGDISLDLGVGTARTERHSTSWHYNYGLDITHDNRDSFYSYGSYPSANMRDELLGSELYRTYADASATGTTAADQNPSTGESDWYTSMESGAVAAYWEHTNFDPNSTRRTDDIEFVGDETNGIVTAYYELQFANGEEENGQKTYVIEATIPRSLFGADNPGVGDSVGFRFMPGCRNDGESDVAVVKLTTTIKGFASLGDYVWYDLNQNGLQDDGSASNVGIPGITVNLYKDGTEPLRSTTTDANGYYNFDNLVPGIYYVEFISGEWEITLPDYNNDNFDVEDSDANPDNGQTGVYTLVVDQHESSVDCGLFTGDPLPVTLSTFNAILNNGTARLQWVTQSESNNALWNIYRAASQNVGQAVKVNYEAIPGSGTTSVPTNYDYNDYTLDEFVDAYDMINPTIYYWLESVDNGGVSEMHGPVYVTVLNSEDEESTPEIPDVYGLNQNYPNPFNPDTGISFNLAKSGQATLVIYDIKGKKVKSIFKDKECLKNHTYTEHWNGKDSRGNTVSSGIYLAVLKSGKEVFTRKMILQK